MLAVIFELQPKQEKFNEYHKLAKYLKPKLEGIDGFIDIDRFASNRTKVKQVQRETRTFVAAGDAESDIYRARSRQEPVLLRPALHSGISVPTLCAAEPVAPRAYANLFLTRATPHGLLGELALIGG